MAYADDVVIMVGKEENLRNVFRKLKKSVKDKGLIIKDSKTKVIRIIRKTETK